MWGFDIPDHPDIASAMRTGYPRWIEDEDEDDLPEPGEDPRDNLFGRIEFIDLI